jgi:phage-related protein
MDAKQSAGHQLRLVQKEKEPDHWRPMRSVGAGVAEIIIQTGDAYRVFYVAKFAEAIYVLHAFQKKTRQTAQNDVDLGRKRYRELMEYRSKHERASRKER